MPFNFAEGFYLSKPSTSPVFRLNDQEESTAYVTSNPILDQFITILKEQRVVLKDCDIRYSVSLSSTEFQLKCKKIFIP
ncbi:hypothetical protein A2V80_01700 [Candidatus Woesebacteria bacterium RBG_16_39_8b]|uniref:Uncharacterized protein n=1 Tax=Candidatus Woesebacteria bacterium RBG_16_39_8b TaxID=1802482 RepID=A0A1F7XC89_9BACT|nr:MAG: hypothetical protein A2V80_01700 [Candidatus Woesebacteria bacterium RBG_16_39_8b]